MTTLDTNIWAAECGCTNLDVTYQGWTEGWLCSSFQEAEQAASALRQLFKHEPPSSREEFDALLNCVGLAQELGWLPEV